MTNAIDYTAGVAGTAPSGLFARISTAIADYRLYRKTIDELQGLTNRELQDLGLSRFSIRQIAFDSVYG